MVAQVARLFYTKGHASRFVADDLNKRDGRAIHFRIKSLTKGKGNNA